MSRILANNLPTGLHPPEQITPAVSFPPGERNSTNCSYYSTYSSYLSIHRLDRKDAGTHKWHHSLQDTHVFRYGVKNQKLGRMPSLTSCLCPFLFLGQKSSEEGGSRWRCKTSCKDVLTISEGRFL